MRSTKLTLQSYDSDKINSGYLQRYDKIFTPWLDKPMKLLELGVHRGGSLQLWRDYFPLGSIAGVDIQLPEVFEPGERIKVFEGSQTDKAFLSRVANEVAPEGFDIIIDDASHWGEYTRISFWHLFDNHLKAGGLYVIEDWGTGYWSDWADGAAASKLRQPVFKPGSFLSKVLRKITPKPTLGSHGYGMVGFVKQLVDEQGAMDLTRAKTSGTPTRSSKFDELIIAPSIVFVRKAGA